MNLDVILQDATAVQHSASDPTHSVWLAANAGTGKTYVLIQRLVRLLLADAALEPRHILALTYSRAAAQEMSHRLGQKVAGWHTLPDKDLKDALTGILGRAPTEEEQETAKGLPDRLAGSGVTIMTLHKFCQTLLRRFPLEAGLSPQFQLWEEAAIEEGLQKAQEAALSEMAEDDHPDYAALAFLATEVGEGRVHDALTSYLNERDKLKPLVLDGGFDVRLREALEIETETSDEELQEALNRAVEIPQRVIQEFIKQQGYFEAFKPNQLPQKHFWQYVSAFLEVYNQEHAPAHKVRKAWENIWLKKDGDPRNIVWAIGKKLMDVLGEDPLTEWLTAQESLRAHMARTANIRTYLATKAFMAIGRVMEESYAAHKRSAAALDFDDLIHHAQKLLHHGDLQDWIKYRLDGGVRHILLDETQDTNQQQWDVVSALMGDFFTGDGQAEEADSAPRTLFVVGDFKQSIYRFQGAQTHVFSAMQKVLTDAKEAGYAARDNVQMVTSFRSVEIILKAVDDVFGQEGFSSTADGQEIEHATARVEEPGSVIVWPPEVLEGEKEEIQAWATSEELPTRTSAKMQLGEKIAAEIRDILAGVQEHHWLTTRDKNSNIVKRLATLNDVLLLVRSRSALPDLTAALVKNGFRYTTVDKPLNNVNHPIAADVLALLGVMVQPRDDVPLASVLRSPLFRMESAELNVLLRAREGKALWDVLPESIKGKLSTWRAAGESNPQKMMMTLLHQGQIVAALAPSIGYDAFAVGESRAIVSAFMTEASRHQTLVDFIRHVKAHGLPVVRPETGGEEKSLRILTVHGSKGLEAPIVFMVDGQRNIYQKGGMGADVLAWGDDVCVFRSSGAQKSALQLALDDQEKERILADELRLLYVAMTRAAQRLYVCAAGDDAKRNSPEALMKTSAFDLPNNWWGMVARAAKMQNWPQEEDGAYHLQTAMPNDVASADEARAEPMGDQKVPDWVFGTLEAQAQKPIQAQSEEQKKGELLHQALAAYCDYGREAALALLQEVPDIALVDGTFAAHPWLLAQGDIEGHSEKSFMHQGKKRIMDRLLIDHAQKTVTIVDYKSDAFVSGEIPLPYAAQLRLYKEIIAQRYPDYTVTAGILWLSISEWVELK